MSSQDGDGRGHGPTGVDVDDAVVTEYLTDLSAAAKERVVRSVARGDAAPLVQLTGALGALRSVASRVAVGVGEAGVVSDAQFVQVLELTGELHRVTGALMTAGVEQIQERSTNTGMSEGLFRRLGFHSDAEMAEHFLGISAGFSNALKKITRHTATKPAGSLGAEPLLPLVGRAVSAGEITVEQAQTITKHLAPVTSRTVPEDLDAAEASLVGLASGGRMGTPPNTAATPDDADSGAGDTHDGQNIDPDSDGTDGTDGTGGVSGTDAGANEGPDAAGILAEPGSPKVLRDVRVRPKALEGPAALWVAAIDPDGKAPSEAIRRRERSLTERHMPGGGLRLTADLSPEAAEQWALLKSTFLSPRNTCPVPTGADGVGTASGQEASAAGGEGDSAGGAERNAGGADAVPGFAVASQGLGHEQRSLAQTQHDALFEIFRLAANAAPVHGSSRPHLLIITRAESIAKALGGRDRVVDQAVAEAITDLADAARNGSLPAEVINAVTTLAGLLATATAGPPSIGDGGAFVTDPHLIRPTTSNDGDGEQGANAFDGTRGSGLGVGPASGGAELGLGPNAATGSVEGATGNVGAGSEPGDASPWGGYGSGEAFGLGNDPIAGAGTNSRQSTGPPPAPGVGGWPHNDPRLFARSSTGPSSGGGEVSELGRFDRWATPGTVGGILPVTGSWVPQESFGAMLCDAVVEVLITRNGAPLALRSAGHRYFTPKQREALTVLYPTCAVEGCTTPAVACDAHHVIPVSKGGETMVANAIHLCNFHHNQLHAGHLKIVPNPDLAQAGGQDGAEVDGQELLPGLIVVPTSTGGHGVNRTTRHQVPAQEPEPVNLTDRTAWNTTTSDDERSDGGWATPGVDFRTATSEDTGAGAAKDAAAATTESTPRGWGYDHPINQASKDAWVRAGVEADQESSSWDGATSSGAQSGIDADGWALPGGNSWGHSTDPQAEPTSSPRPDSPPPVDPAAVTVLARVFGTPPEEEWRVANLMRIGLELPLRTRLAELPRDEGDQHPGPVDLFSMAPRIPQIAFGR